jgi:hypothetical protein
MRIRIVADTILPGITSTLSNGGQSLTLNQWLDTPLPPQQELTLDWLIGVASDVPVGSNITFSIVFESSDDNQGNSQTINRTFVLAVTSHRELVFTHSFIEDTVLEPEQRMHFKVNATSYSSFTEELELQVTGGQVWSVICDNQEESAFQWMKVMPSSNDPDGRRASWDCELTAPSEDAYVPLEFTIKSDNEIFWSDVPDVSVKSVVIDEGGISLGFGTTEQQLPLVIGAVGLLFLIFVFGMIVAINKKRRDGYDDDDDDDVEDNQSYSQQTAAPQIQHTQAPAQHVVAVQPQPSSFTDEQFRAAGWTDDKIAEYRRQEVAEQEDAISAQHAAAQQNAYASQVHQQPAQSQQSLQPIPQQQVPPQQQPTGNLASAFGSLGVTAEPETPEDGDAIDTASALAALGTTTIAVEDSESGAPDSTETTTTSNDGQGLPKVNCGFCQRNLTTEDKWVECPDCGIYSHAECRVGQQVCARCGSSN